MEWSDDERDEITGWLVHVVAPQAIRTWAQDRAKGHRGRWFAVAGHVEALPPVAEWVTHATSHGIGSTVDRAVPQQWTQAVGRTVGTGELGWVLWAINRVASARRWTNEELWPRVMPHGDIYADTAVMALRIHPPTERLRALAEEGRWDEIPKLDR